jgi:hypothetical protein
MAKITVSFKVLNDKNEEVRKISVEIEPGQKWKKRAEEEAMKLIAENEKIELIQERFEKDENVKGATPAPDYPVFVFKYDFIKDDKIERSEKITVRAETREYAWRKSIELAAEKVKEGERVQFAGDVVPGSK